MVNPFPPDCTEKFRAERLLARGGFGSVWLATQLRLNREVAVKLLHSDLLISKQDVQRFLTEARVTAAMSHPNIVRVIDHGVYMPTPLTDAELERALAGNAITGKPGIPWIVYEYLPGRTLTDILKSGPLPWSDALSIAAQVAGALDEAHGHSVLHRDIKPSNILEVSTGVVKITDFGIAKWAQRGLQTRTGMILGTPLYISPEQVEGRPPSASSDLYSLGVLLFEMLTGRLPFEHTNAQILLSMHQAAPAPPPSSVRPDLPAGIDALVLKALAKSIEQRYRSAAEMKEALESFTPQLPPPPPEGSAVRRLRQASSSGLPRVRMLVPATEALEAQPGGGAGAGAGAGPAAGTGAGQGTGPAAGIGPGPGSVASGFVGSGFVGPRPTARLAAQIAMAFLAVLLGVWLLMRPRSSSTGAVGAHPASVGSPDAGPAGESRLRPSELLELETALELLTPRIRDDGLIAELRQPARQTAPDLLAALAIARKGRAQEAANEKDLAAMAERAERVSISGDRVPFRELRVLARVRACRFTCWRRAVHFEKHATVYEKAIREHRDTVMDMMSLSMQVSSAEDFAAGMAHLQRYLDAAAPVFLAVPAELPAGNAGLADLLEDVRHVSRDVTALPWKERSRLILDARVETFKSRLATDPRPVAFTIARLVKTMWELGMSNRLTRDLTLLTMASEDLKMLQLQVPGCKVEVAPFEDRLASEARERARADQPEK